MAHQSMRVEHHPVLGPEGAAEEVIFHFEGQPMTARAGDVIASALLANGVRTLRRTSREGQARGLYCAIGHCFECQVTVDGRAGTRACITHVKPGMRVERDSQVHQKGRDQ